MTRTTMAITAPDASVTRTVKTPAPATIATTEKATAAVTAVQAGARLAEAGLRGSVRARTAGRDQGRIHPFLPL